MKYNPHVAPDPRQWLETDEMERNELVRAYHRRVRAKLPSEQAHTAFHVVVENQAALGDETPVAETITRLMAEGLDRHEAIHAVASVLAGHMWELVQSGVSRGVDPNTAYFRHVRELTAKKWLETAGDTID